MFRCQDVELVSGLNRVEPLMSVVTPRVKFRWGIESAFSSAHCTTLSAGNALLNETYRLGLLVSIRAVWPGEQGSTMQNTVLIVVLGRVTGKCRHGNRRMSANTLVTCIP